MRLVRVTLWLTALGFLGFGAFFLVHPRGLEATGAALLTPTSRFEVRSFYGGFELGCGAFFLLAALREAWYGIAIRAQVCMFAGLVAGRFISLAADGVPTASLLFFMSLEIFALLLGLIAMRTTIPTQSPR